MIQGSKAFKQFCDKLKEYDLLDKTFEFLIRSGNGFVYECRIENKVYQLGFDTNEDLFWREDARSILVKCLSEIDLKILEDIKGDRTAQKKFIERIEVKNTNEYEINVFHKL